MIVRFTTLALGPVLALGALAGCAADAPESAQGTTEALSNGAPDSLELVRNDLGADGPLVEVSLRRTSWDSSNQYWVEVRSTTYSWTSAGYVKRQLATGAVQCGFLYPIGQSFTRAFCTGDTRAADGALIELTLAYADDHAPVGPVRGTLHVVTAGGFAGPPKDTTTDLGLLNVASIK